MTSERALVIVDVQQDFCEGGSLAVGGGADVARAISAYVQGHRDQYAAIVATRDYHVDPGDHFAAEPDFANSWPRHCVAGTSGADFHPDLDTGPIEEVFDKGGQAAAYSGFEGRSAEGVALHDWLMSRRISSLDIAGIATDYCVRATALDAAAAGFDTVVLEDLIAGVAEPSSSAAIVEMRDADVTIRRAVPG